MNQRIEVRSLVKKDGKILLLKRAGGSEDLKGKYELPGGKIEPNEQPEEAVKRSIREATGLEASVVYLSDVFTYTSHGDRPVQRAVIVYIVSVSGNKDASIRI